MVWVASGGPVSFLYEAGAGVAFGGVQQADGLSLLGRIDFTTGTDLAFEGRYAYVGSEDPSALEGGLHIVDISNPARPVEVGRLACPAVQNDVGVWRGIVVMAIDSASSNAVCDPGKGKEGVRVVDARNPRKPKQIAFFDQVTGSGAHTVTTVADTGYVYVSNNFGDAVDVIDLRPALRGGKPALVKRIPVAPSAGCHDITVSGARAYCAAMTRTEIWDIADPLAPLVLARIVNPLIDIHHSTAVEGTILVIGDEFTGAEAAAGCQAGERAPTGSLWFYDITDETRPVPHGYFTPREVYPGVRCTAHNFNIVPGRNLVVAGWYKAGTRLVDFSDPAHPTEAGYLIADGAITWSAYWHNGAIFTGDMHRGMDVIGVDGLTTRVLARRTRPRPERPAPRAPLPATGVKPPLLAGLLWLGAAGGLLGLLRVPRREPSPVTQTARKRGVQLI